MEEISSMDEDFTLLTLLLQTRDIILRFREKELSRYGILPRQSSVLFNIQALGDEARPVELAQRMFREYHTISTILNRMEKDGLVRKVKDPDRKKAVRVVLTEKGQQAYQQSIKRESIHQVVSALSAKERQQLRSCLEKLRDEALKGLGMSRKPPFP